MAFQIFSVSVETYKCSSFPHTRRDVPVGVPIHLSMEWHELPKYNGIQVSQLNYPHTTRDWNVLPDSLMSSAELSDDCVSKFSSLVRGSDYM